MKIFLMRDTALKKHLLKEYLSCLFLKSFLAMIITFCLCCAL